jgi:uncharacterized membrane protein YeaQ/YmgE (transglycosylase-associated protein family)
MTPYHVIVILIGAGLAGYGVHEHQLDGVLATIVAGIIGAAAGNAQTRAGQRATDQTPKAGGT